MPPAAPVGGLSLRERPQTGHLQQGGGSSRGQPEGTKVLLQQRRGEAALQHINPSSRGAGSSCWIEPPTGDRKHCPPQAKVAHSRGDAGAGCCPPLQRLHPQLISCAFPHASLRWAPWQQPEGTHVHFLQQDMWQKRKWLLTVLQVEGLMTSCPQQKVRTSEDLRSRTCGR